MPFDVAAIGRERQVEVEDLVLGQPLFQRERHQHLAESCRRPSGSIASERSRATCMVRVDAPETGRPCAHELQRGAEKRLHVDAAVLAEAPVLVGDQRLDEERVDLGERDRQPPAPVGDREGAEQHAVAVDDDAAGFRGERRKLDLRHGDLQRDRRRGRDEAGGEEGAREAMREGRNRVPSPLAGERSERRGRTRPRPSSVPPP